MAQQRHFPVALVKQLLGLLHNRLRISAALTTAGERDDAERAHVVAASHDADERCDAAFVEANGTDLRVRLFTRQQDVDGFLAALHLVHQVGQIPVGVGPHNEVHQLLLLEQLVSQAFGHAPQNAHHKAGVLPLVGLEVDQAVAHPLLRIVPDGAGVQQHQICVVRFPGRLEARVGQDARHDFTVAEIHLTAVALEVQFSPRCARPLDHSRFSLSRFLQGLMSFSHGANVHHCQIVTPLGVPSECVLFEVPCERFSPKVVFNLPAQTHLHGQKPCHCRVARQGEND